MAELVLAGGCFWGSEKFFSLIKGVSETVVGYANGQTEHPTYKEVCSGKTGYAEAVKIVYDPAVLPLAHLLELFYESINPFSLNRQGGDVGTQYRTGIYYVNKEDKEIAEQSLNNLQRRSERKVHIELEPLCNFYPAEEYHQKYLDKNPGGYCHISPAQFEKAAGAMVNPTLYHKPDEDILRANLSPAQYAVTQESDTEPPFRNEFWNAFQSGIYVDITTGEPLFTSENKFDSGCGWPSFSKPIDPGTIREKDDFSYGRHRVEVRSRTGDAHLGHVFEDGPKELGGLRYCINSAALRFIPKSEMEKEGYGYLLDYVKE